MIPEEWNEDLEADLRRDATTWDAAPSGNTTDRIRAATSELPVGPVSESSRSPIVLGPVFAIGILALIAWGMWGGTTLPAAPREQHLEHELGALGDDVRALADAVWQRVSVSLRRLRMD